MWLVFIVLLVGVEPTLPVGWFRHWCKTERVISVIVIGPRSIRGVEILAHIGAHRGDFMIDGLVDDGADPDRLAELVMDFTPLRLGITDEYAELLYRSRHREMATDAGILDWELPEVEVRTGSDAVQGVVDIGCDVVIICDAKLISDPSRLNWTGVGRIVAWQPLEIDGLILATGDPGVDLVA